MPVIWNNTRRPGKRARFEWPAAQDVAALAGAPTPEEGKADEAVDRAREAVGDVLTHLTRVREQWKSSQR